MLACIKMNNFYKRLWIALTVCVLLFGGASDMGAVPAKRGILTVCQPDGSLIRVCIEGDEYGHILTSESGEALSADEDGWYCYASYTLDGQIVNSRVRYGTQDVSEETISQSRVIPREAIAMRSAQLRMRREDAIAGAHSQRMRAPLRPEYDAPKPVVRAVVLLVQFPDLEFKFDQSYFVNLLTQKGYSYGGATGSALDYFNDQYRGASQFEFDVRPVVTLSHGYSYYGTEDSSGNDNTPVAVSEACSLNDADVDFSKYDFVYMFYAGGNPADGSADEHHIWPHSYSIAAYNYYHSSNKVKGVFDGNNIEYACSSELNNAGSGRKRFTHIGTFCHEFSHTLGLPDFYDTDYSESGGNSVALGSESIMCQGSYNNNSATPPNYTSVELEMAGLLTPEDLGSGIYTLKPLSSRDERHALRVYSDNTDEYYLLEARNNVGWDKYISGYGLLLYHIDRTTRPAGFSTTYQRTLSAADRWQVNEINANPDYQCCEIIGTGEGSAEATWFWPYGMHNFVGSLTSPGITFRSGYDCELSITNIKKSTDGVTFSIVSPLEFTVVDPYQDAVILGWTSSYQDTDECTLQIFSSAGNLISETHVQPYETGTYSSTVEGLNAGRDYTAKVTLELGNGARTMAKYDFRTKAYGGRPFIVMTDSEGQRLKRIPLRVYNVQGAGNIEWKLGNTYIKPEKDGYYTLPSSGTLRAYVNYKDGGLTIISKTL